MELGNSITIIALRANVPLAWGIARAARALGHPRVAMEGAVERQAHRTQVDIDAVLEPLITDARN